MLIQAYRRREPITVDLGGSWAFKPNKAGHIVCDVADDIAQDLIDRIPEAYVAYDGEAPAADGQTGTSEASAPPPPPNPDEARALAAKAQKLVGSSRITDETVKVGETDVAIEDIVQAAFKRFGKSKAAWNAQDQADIDDAVETELNAMRLAEQKRIEAQADATKDTKWVIRNQADGAEIDLAKLDDKAMREFAKSVGIQVNNGLKGDKIRAVIVAAVKGE